MIKSNLSKVFLFVRGTTFLCEFDERHFIWLGQNFGAQNSTLFSLSSDAQKISLDTSKSLTPLKRRNDEALILYVNFESECRGI